MISATELIENMLSKVLQVGHPYHLVAMRSDGRSGDPFFDMTSDGLELTALFFGN